MSNTDASPADHEGRAGTLHPLVREYVRGRLERREITAGTGVNDRGVLYRFAAIYGNRPVKNMSGSDIERWQATQARLAPGTRRHEIGVVRGFVRWLQRCRHLKNDPMVHIVFPTMPRRIPRALTRDQVEALTAVLPDLRARAIVALMVGCGLRKIEIHRLQVGDWDRRQNTLNLVGKGLHERTVPISGHVAEVLTEYVGGLSFGPMIRREDGVPLSTDQIGKLMRKWMYASGIKEKGYDGKGCHSLRHTIASEIADVEPDLRVVQEFLGHVSLTTTQIYLRRAGLSKMRAAMERAAPTPDGVPAVCGRLAADLEAAMRAIHDEFAPRAAQIQGRANVDDVDLAAAERFYAEVQIVADRAEHVVRTLTALTGRYVTGTGAWDAVMDIAGVDGVMPVIEGAA